MPYLSLTGHSYVSSETLINNLILYLQKILAVDVVDLDLIFELTVMMKDTCSRSLSAVMRHLDFLVLRIL